MRFIEKVNHKLKSIKKNSSDSKTFDIQSVKDNQEKSNITGLHNISSLDELDGFDVGNLHVLIFNKNFMDIEMNLNGFDGLKKIILTEEYPIEIIKKLRKKYTKIKFTTSTNK
jgi:hypothetical protein